MTSRSAVANHYAIALAGINRDTKPIRYLAAASAVSATVYGLLLLIPLVREDKQLLSGGFVADLVKMLLATGAMLSFSALYSKREPSLSQSSQITTMLYRHNSSNLLETTVLNLLIFAKKSLSMLIFNLILCKYSNFHAKTLHNLHFCRTFAR